MAHKVRETEEENIVTPSPMPEPPAAGPSLRMPKKQRETPKPPSDEHEQEYVPKEAGHQRKAIVEE